MFRRLAMCLAVLASFSVACDDDDPAGPTSGDLVGSWELSMIELVSVANPNTRVDLMDEGVTATLDLEADGDFAFVVTDPVEGVEAFVGHWAWTDVLSMEHVGGQFVGTWEFDVSLTGDVLRLTGADAEFDFNDDDVEEAAKLNLTGARS